MKVIKEKKLNIIKEIAKKYKELEIGEKKGIVKEQEILHQLLNIHQSRKEIELKMNKEYRVIIENNENINNSRKWSHYCRILVEDKIKIIKETDCFYVLDNNKKISKDKIKYIIEK